MIFRWDFHNAFFFAGTLVSTIGYGNVSPVTQNGKLFCIFFVAFGVPYFAYLLTILSEVISDALRIAGEKFDFNRGVEQKAGGLNMVSILYILIGRVSNLCSSSRNYWLFLLTRILFQFKSGIFYNLPTLA